MKICWDNLEKLVYIKEKRIWKQNSNVYIYMDSCKTCKEPYLTNKRTMGIYCSNSCSQKGVVFSKETRRKMSLSKKEKYNGKNNPNWKGDYYYKNIPLYDTYAEQIMYAEPVRRNLKDRNILEVKCAYCGKWHIPKRSTIQYRIQTLKRILHGEARLYCSNSCKKECPIFNKQKYPKEYKQTSSREVQPELRQLVFERDNWTCMKCNSKKNLHCHHIEGIRWEPLESADIDKCITYCKECHKEVHKKEDCKTVNMRCK